MSERKLPYGLVNADCLDAMKNLPDNFVDSIVTDPPYGLSFMGKNWDHGVPGVEFWKEALRVIKPGGHIVAFGGSRTYHRLACAIEDAGWEIRDSLGWLYSSGFPKSMNIGLAIDKKMGVESIDTGIKSPNARPNCNKSNTIYESGTVGKTFTIKKARNEWGGWGTCLKPAFEPIVLARKPLEGTVVENVMKYGVGGLNIDECRVPTDGETICTHSKNAKSDIYGKYNPVSTHQSNGQKLGRFPANIIHDGSEEVLEVFPSNVKGGSWKTTKGARHFNNNGEKTDFENHGSDKSVGSAARFFYCPKASKKEKGKENTHPTVKPIALMEYLVKLISPNGSLVLDPFMGSGSTGVAALNLGRKFIGIEKEEEYFNIAKKRIEDVYNNSENVV